jgi:hypothetical protein
VNAVILRARLYVIGAAVLVLLGGMMFAIGRWNASENDRAFVEAAARAARMPAPTPQPPRYWAPTAGARPGAEATVRIEAAERLRTMPNASPSSRPPQAPQAPRPPGNKPPVTTP